MSADMKAATEWAEECRYTKSQGTADSNLAAAFLEVTAELADANLARTELMKLLRETTDDLQAAEQRAAELQARLDRVEDALRVVLPMAKGYAAVHPVGRNADMIVFADNALAAAGGQTESAAEKDKR